MMIWIISRLLKFAALEPLVHAGHNLARLDLARAHQVAQDTGHLARDVSHQLL
jgi:hypothetical protein